MVDHVNLKIAHRYWDNQPKICSSPPPPSPLQERQLPTGFLFPPTRSLKKQFSS